LPANPNDYNFNAGEEIFSVWERTLQSAKLQEKWSDIVQNGNSNIQQEDGSFCEQIRLKMSEEPNEVLHYEHSSVLC
jgi:hypothetical protein